VADASTGQRCIDVYADQLDSFARAISVGDKPVGSRLRCLGRSQCLPHGVIGTVRKIFVTGATGFIGGRLAEVASERGLHVIALVRDWSRAARLARLPVIMVHGDILNSELSPG
jgi:hypothetical protein